MLVLVLVLGAWLVERLVPSGQLSTPSLLPVSCFLAFRLRPLFLISAAVALLAQLAILRSVIAGRAPASTPGRSARVAEIAWVALPTLVLIAVLWLTWNRLGEPIAVAPVAGVRA